MEVNAIHSFLQRADSGAIGSLHPEVKKRVHDLLFNDPLSDSEQGVETHK
jgi:hypothetical protein